MATSSEDQEEMDREFQAALALRDAGKMDEALRMLRALALRQPKRPAILGVIAGIEYQMNDLEGAARDFRRTTQLSLKSELASLGLFHSLHELGHLADAFDEVARYRSIRPSADYDEMLAEYLQRAENELKKDATNEFYKELRDRITAELRERPLKGSGG